MPDRARPVDAHDLSIVIPFRRDVPERRANLRAVLTHLSQTLGGAEILLLEDDADAGSGRDLTDDIPGLRHLPFCNSGPFHRTRLLNLGIEQLATRPFAAAWDTDVVIYPDAMAAALGHLRAGAGLVYPYDGRFIDLRGAARAQLLAGPPLPDPALWPRQRHRWWQRRLEATCLNTASVGGAVLFDRDSFARTGGYHEGFRAWGFEDAEIRDRMVKLGERVASVPDRPLLHLWHPRHHRRGGAWYATVRENAALHRRMAALDHDALRALIASGGLRDGSAAPRDPRRETSP